METDTEPAVQDCAGDAGSCRRVEHEPEAWSVTMDRSALNAMSATDIKRQDHIWGICLAQSVSL